MEYNVENTTKFFDQIAELEKEVGISLMEIKLYHIPDYGLVIPEGISSDVRSRIFEIYDEVFKD